MCVPAVDPAWQLEVNPVRVRLRELVSIPLATQACNARWHSLVEFNSVARLGKCPSRSAQVDASRTIGRIIEIVGGQTLYQFARQHIFDPLGMAEPNGAPIRNGNPAVARWSRPLDDYARSAQMILNGGELEVTSVRRHPNR